MNGSTQTSTIEIWTPLCHYANIVICICMSELIFGEFRASWSEGKNESKGKTTTQNWARCILHTVAQGCYQPRVNTLTAREQIGPKKLHWSEYMCLCVDVESWHSYRNLWIHFCMKLYLSFFTSAATKSSFFVRFVPFAA